jgi:hypothetical protein
LRTVHSRSSTSCICSWACAVVRACGRSPASLSFATAPRAQKNKKQSVCAASCCVYRVCSAQPCLSLSTSPARASVLVQRPRAARAPPARGPEHPTRHIHPTTIQPPSNPRSALNSLCRSSPRRALAARLAAGRPLRRGRHAAVAVQQPRRQLAQHLEAVHHAHVAEHRQPPSRLHGTRWASKTPMVSRTQHNSRGLASSSGCGSVA